MSPELVLIRNAPGRDKSTNLPHVCLDEQEAY